MNLELSLEQNVSRETIELSLETEITYYFEVLIPYFLRNPLKYKSTIKYLPGSLVTIELKNKIIIGVIKSECQIESIKDLKIKDVLGDINQIKFSAPFLQYLEALSHFNLQEIGMFFKLAIPSVFSTLAIKNKEKFEESFQKSSFSAPHSGLATIDPKPYTLTMHQNKAVADLNDAFKIMNAVLLEGETGSGKTEVYLECTKNLLLSNPSAQVLILVPEIALTKALIERIALRLGQKVCEWHSKLTPSTRLKNYLSIIQGVAQLIVGARSGILLPFKNLRLIVIDEEHDSSYKQDQITIYHAREAAELRSKIENVQLILTTATPSLESVYAVKIKQCQYVRLETYKSLAESRRTEIIDMNNEFGPISNKVFIKVKEYLDKNLQSMIFINRRGYSSFTICECKQKVMCKDCTIALVFHKESNIMMCHYCGWKIKKSLLTCMKCSSSDKFRSFGFGVEKIHEIFAERFPNTAIKVFSSDLTSNENIEETIKDIENNKIKIIIGTQMLAKGHNFPHLAFLTIVDGGLTFSGLDLRAAEKTYQVLHQVSGRTGRFDIKGEVIIQTFEPNSLILQAIIAHNKIKFYTAEALERQEFCLPPFFNLIKISFASYNATTAKDAAFNFSRSLKYDQNVKVSGPVISSILRLSKLYRYNLFLKSRRSFDLQDYLKKEIDKIPVSKKVVMKIDVNPQNFI